MLFIIHAHGITVTGVSGQLCTMTCSGVCVVCRGYYRVCGAAQDVQGEIGLDYAGIVLHLVTKPLYGRRILLGVLQGSLLCLTPGGLRFTTAVLLLTVVLLTVVLLTVVLLLPWCFYNTYIHAPTLSLSHTQTLSLSNLRRLSKRRNPAAAEGWGEGGNGSSSDGSTSNSPTGSLDSLTRHHTRSPITTSTPSHYTHYTNRSNTDKLA